MNRIATAQSQATSGQHDWGLSFSYDIWANLQSATVTKGDDVPMLSVTANNKNQLQGFGYDAAGNMTQDGTAAYTYDAESRLLTAGGVTYGYDGDGRRVKKSNGKLYWYGAGSEVLLESDLAGATLDEYIFFNGKRAARRKADGQVHYYFADHLGSSRVVTNATGQILDDADFYPFGGERVVVSSSGNNYKFTGEERDSESGTDYFNARQYAYSLGRFLQPDEFTDGPVELFAELAAANPTFYANPANPQSLNKYSYVYNNPSRYIDPTGHEATSGCGSWSPCGMTTGGPEPAKAPGPVITDPWSPVYMLLNFGYVNTSALSPSAQLAIARAAQSYGFDAKKFERLILAAAKKHGIDPNLLVGLAARESGLNPNAFNPKENARGLFQIRPDRQKDLLIADADIYKIEIQIDKVAGWMSRAISRYGGDIDKAIAAWNLGDTKLQHHVGLGGMERVRNLLMDKNDPKSRRFGEFYIDFIKSFMK